MVYYKFIGIITLFALIAGCSNQAVQSKQAISRDGIQEVPFTIAGGKKVLLKISNQGAEPAEDEKIKITATAVLVGPRREKEPALIWSFGLISKTTDKISKITVENVFPDNPAVLLVTDEQPKFKNGSKSGNGDWIGQIWKGDPYNNPWLKSKKASIFVFKFTVFFENETQSSLYQLSVFSEDTKQYFLKLAENIRKNGSANNSSSPTDRFILIP